MNPRAFRQHDGVVAPLLRSNVDTDAIIPSREMKRVSREGLAEGLFAGWRYLPGGDREPDPDFVLNDPRYASATILAAGHNFGCGSSREHAVWALVEFGIRVILAPSFAAIFERNCVNNGLLPVTLEEPAIEDLLAQTEPDPQRRCLHVDLEAQSVGGPDGRSVPFRISPSQRSMLLNGWDPIDLTLQRAETIDQFEQRDRVARPWVYPCKHDRSLA
jgi:3-isopropylmalate/(R)-2-methylmalate dehydratase small subunit